MLKRSRAVEQQFFIENLKPVLFLEGDIIILEGELGDQVFFIHKGIAKVYLTQKVKGLPDPTVSGEISKSVYINDPNFNVNKSLDHGASVKFAGLDDNE